ncbi:DUF4229 domain-containing protein [Brachybacterium sacelli]|uniref:DUF4229 domain-containing protein n=1 Tax=Brachybacterium sacelli TaxID=173364 RepID=A0ABS4X3W0_9MICO|nr:DUF4229 domain-containing protein [Brachybacterium sacelli]MBP2383149.1 hypothetical protein [Brachybacterium sacelli]
MRDMALFAVIRLILWVGIWWLLTLVDVGVMLAAVLAALIAMLISILFLDRLRSSAALRWKAADERRRARKGEPVDEDAEAEDAALDAEGETPDGADVEEQEGRAAGVDGTAGPTELPDLADGVSGDAHARDTEGEDSAEDPASSRSRRD